MEEKLLQLIEKEARYSVSDLAMALQESEEHVLDTMSELEKKRIICGYHTLINWDKTNKEKVQALIQINATPEREYGYDRVASRIARYPEVDTLYLLSGSSEFIVEVSGKTMQDVAMFVGSKLACIEGVTGTSTLFVLKKYKKAGMILEDNEDRQERLVVTP